MDGADAHEMEGTVVGGEEDGEGILEPLSYRGGVTTRGRLYIMSYIMLETAGKEAEEALACFTMYLDRSLAIMVRAPCWERFQMP